MKKRIVIVAACLGFAQLGLSDVAYAQDTSKVLDDVVVTATRSPKRMAEIGKVVRIITSEQIERSQGRTVPDLLNNVAGITFSGLNTSFSNASTSFYLRGASPGNTLILINGIPVNDAQSISNEYDLKSFAIDQIERIEILKGGNSTLYGSDAVAGVINIITKKVPSTSEFKANVLFSGGSYNYLKQAVGISGSALKTGVNLNYSHSSSDEFSSALDDKKAGNFDKDGLKQHAVNFNTNTQLNSKLSLGTNLQFTSNKGDSDGGAFTDDKDYTYVRDFLFAGLSGKYALNKGSLNLNVSRNIVWNDFRNLSIDGSAYSKTNNEGRIWQADLFLNKQLSDIVELNSGVNYRSSNSDQFSDYQSEFYSSTGTLSSDSTQSSISSAFASLFLKNLAGFHLEAGTRYNNHSEYGGNFTYTFNPSYTINDRYKFFVNLSSAFKAPTLYQLYSEYGNLKLKPELSNTYDIGFDLDVLPGMLNINATAFERDTKDVIYFFTDPLTYKSSYQNGRKQYDKGFELEIRVNPVKTLSLNTYYSYVKGKLKIDESKTLNDLYRRPKSQFGASANYKALRNLTVGVISKYTGKRKEQDFRTYPETIVTHKSYTLFDAYIQYSPIKSLTLFGDFKNLTNKDYIEWIGYNVRGFNCNAGIRYQIK